jgi:hypothetical protein
MHLTLDLKSPALDAVWEYEYIGGQSININKCDRVFVKYLANKYWKNVGVKKFHCKAI